MAPLEIPSTSPSHYNGPIYFECQHCGKGVKAPAGSSGKKGRCPRCQKVGRIPDATLVAPPISVPHYADHHDNEDILVFRWAKRILNGTPTEYAAVQREARKTLDTLQRIRDQFDLVINESPRRIKRSVEFLRKESQLAQLDAIRVDQFSAFLGPDKAQVLTDAGYSMLTSLRGVSGHTLQQISGIGPATAAKVLRAVATAEQDVFSRSAKQPLPDEIDAKHHSLLQAAGRLVNLAMYVPNTLRSLIERECSDLERQLKAATKSSSLLVRVWYTPAKRHEEAATHQTLANMVATSAARAVREGLAALQCIEPPGALGQLVEDYRARFAHYSSVLEKQKTRAVAA